MDVYTHIWDRETYEPEALIALARTISRATVFADGLNTIQEAGK